MAADSNPNPSISNDDYDFFLTLPPGFRFKPREDELIIHYLDKKVQNKPLPMHKIYEVDLYQYNPQDLTAMYQPYVENEWYFFTPRNRKYPKGDRPKRSTLDGYWKATGADKTITNEVDETEIGHKKTLVYYKGEARSGVNTEWIMREYRVDASKKEKGSKLLDDVVLCRLHKKNAKNSSKKKQKNSSKRKQKKVASKRNGVKDDKADQGKHDDDDDDKGPCSDIQLMNFDSGSALANQYQENLLYFSDHMIDYPPSYWQHNFMMLNADQEPLLLPMPCAPAL